MASSANRFGWWSSTIRMRARSAGSTAGRGDGGGWMGRGHDPLWILKDPNAADFSVPELTLLKEVSPERLSHRASGAET